ncbi:DegT/DnrJ/EryC1/StrS family aminotransferase, partial [Pseudarthrobacter oxydans]|uniref:DegT/DnrJ/EryC1/StrS family aminotransferase n=1 Tax=Pseudarthrobacter oxydans TaxID=1671 RepID=UPI0038259E12
CAQTSNVITFHNGQWPHFQLAFLALFSVGVNTGDEVIVPAYSFFASASCIVHAGATPVFVDVDPKTYAATPETIEGAITARTKGVLLVHLFHTMADIESVADLCDRRRLLLLEDSAEAIGMRRGGRHAGLFGLGGALSFFPTKTWGGLGDGGAVLTDDPGIAERVQAVFRGEHAPSWVSRMDALQAAVLLARAERLDREIVHRAHLAERYSDRLRLLPGINTPHPPVHGPGDTSVWYVYLIEFDRRDELVEWLAVSGVETEVYYPKVIPDQPCFRGHLDVDLPIARRAASRAIGLPLYADMTEHEIDIVCDAIERFIDKEINS